MKQINVRVSSLLHNDSEPGTFILFLQEESGIRQLSFAIGLAATQDINRYLEQMVTNRPMTHDLIITILSRLSIELVKVGIWKRTGDIFYAQLICISPELGEVLFDARPTDAISLALKLKTPIYVEESLFDEV